MPYNDEIETLIRQNGMDPDKTQLSILRGKYENLEKIGSGGMGKVYRAHDTTLNRDVAIKQFALPDNTNEDTLRDAKIAFQREATLLANLKHESLPVMYECFTEHDNQYLVMEFVEGEDLKKRVKELKEKFYGQYPVEKVRQWAKELLNVLIYLHERDSPIFHRDIKPENLKIRDEKICLLDFGLAKGSFGGPSSSDVTFFGYTRNYAPVEQMKGGKTTVQTDLYALAATLYYLLTGIVPIDASTRDTALAAHQADPLIPVKKLRLETDNAFAEIITRGLAVSAQERPQSAREMLDILEASEPSPIPPPVPPPQKSWLKLIVLSLVGVAVLFIFAGVVAVVLILFLRTPQNPTPSPTNIASKSPPTTSSTVNTEKTLLSECELYDNYRGKTTDKLDKDTKVKVDDHREDSSGIWYNVKAGSKSGWILCEKSKPCVSN